MPKTKNIGLNLTNNNATYFDEWQKSLDGVGVGTDSSPFSNMQIIDNAFGDVKKDIWELRNAIISSLNADYGSDE